MPTPNTVEEARESLERIQQFDTSSLDRTTDLGTQLSFSEAIDPASKLIRLYKQLPVDILPDLYEKALQEIKSRADGDFSTLNDVIKFSLDEENPSGQNPSHRAQKIVVNIQSSYDRTFQILHPWISYSAQRLTDFRDLEDRARAAVQSISDRTTEIEKELEGKQITAQEILDQVRKTAEEQGVTQQAKYFKEQADSHEKESEKWLKVTVWLIAATLVLAVISGLLHKWSWITNNGDYYSIIQLGITKFLVFGGLSFLVVMTAKTYRANQHNAIVNRHRQNALVTYKALVDAGEHQGTRDIVLAHAADCIFSPQPTGYSKHADDNEPISIPSVSIQPRITSAT